MLKLPDVTIWTMVWNDDRQWISKAGKVLRYCRKIIDCPRVILFANERIRPGDYPFDIVRIPQLNWQSYNIFVNRVVPTYINTPFAMSVHEDGFPLDVSLWRQEFLDYDYIGAPWHDRVVGNGGFNIESRKLMDLKCSLPVLADEFSTASDRFICTSRRKQLEELGVRFAPLDLALAFSTEQIGNDQASFGFHGRGPAKVKYDQGWRIINGMPLREHDGFLLERNKAVPGPRSRPAQPQPSAALGEVKAAMVYVYPSGAGGQYEQWARRFVDSYVRHAAGYPHDSIVVINGGSLTPRVRDLFKPLANVRFFMHDNSGYDIGAFQRVSAENPGYDVIAFFGASAYLRGAGWMRRVVESSQKHGAALYGTHGNRGDSRANVFPHVRTTGWWIRPELFNRYPYRITRASQRYEFEHGRTSLAEWIKKQGLKIFVVTWDGEHEWANWDSFPEGFHRGKQTALIAGDRLTEPPYYQFP